MYVTYYQSIHVGLNEYDDEGEWLVQRQVLWKIPKHILDKVQGKPSGGESQRRSWSFTSGYEEKTGEVHVLYSVHTLILHPLALS